MGPWLASFYRSKPARRGGPNAKDDDMAHSAEMGSVLNPIGIGLDPWIGFALVAGLPALFWTGVAAALGAALGLTLTLGWAVAIAGSIAGFLGVIYRAVRNNSDGV